MRIGGKKIWRNRKIVGIFASRSAPRSQRPNRTLIGSGDMGLRSPQKLKIVWGPQIK